MGVRTGVSLGPEDFSGLRLKRGAAPANSSSLVYVVKGPHKHIKLGISADPLARLASLQTGSPIPLELAYVAAVKSGNGYAIEQAAHETLSRYRGQGEWFDVEPEAVVAAINAASYSLRDQIVSIDPKHLAYALELAKSPEGKPLKGFSKIWASNHSTGYKIFVSCFRSIGVFFAFAFVAAIGAIVAVLITAAMR